MALTVDFKETIQARAERDPEFRAALLREAVQAMIDGEVELGKAVLRDYIKATVGFEKLGRKVHKHPKSLMRMFSAAGNPQAVNLFGVIAALQKEEGLDLRVISRGQRRGGG